MNSKIIFLFFILILIASCKSDKQSALLSEYLKENYSIYTKHKDISFLILKENGCYSCNKKLELYLDTVNEYNFDFLILVSKYPQNLESKYRTKFNNKLLIDKTDKLYRMNIGLQGSGKLLIINGKISKVEQYIPSQNDKTFFQTNQVR